MGEFGAGISALLEAYGKCLSLLKAFKGHSRPQDDSKISDAHSQLRKSIRSDRSRVRAAYTARLYRDGKRLSHGDCKCSSCSPWQPMARKLILCKRRQGRS